MELNSNVIPLPSTIFQKVQTTTQMKRKQIRIWTTLNLHSQLELTYLTKA